MKLVYFSWIRERVGFGEEEVVLPEDVTTITQLFDWLRARGDEFSSFLEQPDIIRVALDRQHVGDREADITQAREIALFPPMTGG